MSSEEPYFSCKDKVHIYLVNFPHDMVEDGRVMLDKVDETCGRFLSTPSGKKDMTQVPYASCIMNLNDMVYKILRISQVGGILS